MKLVIPSAVAVAVLLTGCGAGSSPSAAPVQTVTVTVPGPITTVFVTTEAPAPVPEPAPAQPASVAIPNLDGTNASIASDKYDALGLTSFTFRSTGENGAMPINLANWTVVKSEPAAGTKVKFDDSIVVTVKRAN